MFGVSLANAVNPTLPSQGSTAALVIGKTISRQSLALPAQQVVLRIDHACGTLHSLKTWPLLGDRLDQSAVCAAFGRGVKAADALLALADR